MPSPEPLRLFIPELARLYQSTWLLAEAILRLATGLLLVPHGAQKLFGAFGGQGFSETVRFFDAMGYWPALFWAPYIGCLQFFGGILLAIGFLTRPIAFLLSVLFLFSFYFRVRNGFFATEGGVEHVILCSAALLFFAIRGGNDWSVDAKMQREF
jgi:putative oxidoreductase